MTACLRFHDPSGSAPPCRFPPLNPAFQNIMYTHSRLATRSIDVFVVISNNCSSNRCPYGGNFADDLIGCIVVSVEPEIDFLRYPSKPLVHPSFPTSAICSAPPPPNFATGLGRSLLDIRTNLANMTSECSGNINLARYSKRNLYDTRIR